MDSYLTKILFCIGCFISGASSWVMLERFEKVPAMCLVDAELYDAKAVKK